MRPNSKGGRPRLYRNRQQFQKKIDEYFQLCADKQHPPTMRGLSLFLGFRSTSQLRYLETKSKAKGQFSVAVKKARTRVEQALEEKMLDPETPDSRVRAIVFILSSMPGWRPKKEPGAEPGQKQRPAIEEVGTMEAWVELDKSYQAARQADA